MEDRPRQILIPQFSIRWLLALTAVCALVFSVFGLAVQGSYWAAGVSIGIASLAVLLLVHGLMFALVWGFSMITAQFRGKRAGQSPFSSTDTRSDKDVPATPILLE